MKIIRNIWAPAITVAALFLVVSLVAEPTHAADWQLQFAMGADADGKAALHPAGMYVDMAHERYYIIDSGLNRLLSFDKSGKALHSFNAGDSLKRPIGMARNQAGRLIIIERGRDSLTEIDLQSKKIKRHKLAGHGIFPQRLLLFNKEIYLLDKVSGSILVVNDKFAMKRRYRCRDCELGFVDMQVADNGEVFALSRQPAAVWKFKAGGKLSAKIKLVPPPDFAAALAISPTGRIFVAERHTGGIKVYAATGKFLYEFLTRGERAEQVSYPVQMAFDFMGRLCVLDEGNGRLAVFGQ